MNLLHVYCIQRAKKVPAEQRWWRFAYKHTNTVRQGSVIVIFFVSVVVVVVVIAL